jgi:hypothetical protein
MYVKKHVVAVKTNASGSATAYTAEPLNGRILKIIYTKHPTNPFDAGVDFTITTEDTKQNLWIANDVNASKSVCPAEKVQDTSGADIVYTIGEVNFNVYAHINAAFERVKIVVSNGGNAKDGTFTILEG